MVKMQGSERINWFLYFCASSANFLGFSIGHAYSWTSPAIPMLYGLVPGSPLTTPITRDQESWIIGLLCLGAGCGPLLAGAFIDKYGRKNALLLSAAFLTASFVTIGSVSSVIFYLPARFVMGLGCGFMYTALPMYTGEIAEPSNRGRIGCLVGITSASGVFLCYAVGSFTSLRIFTFVCAVPSILCFFTFGIFAPESPYHHIGHGDKPAAIEALKKLRTDGSSIEKELIEIEKYVHESKTNKGGFTDLIKSRRGMKSLSICTGIMIFQQFSGIAVVIASMQSILDASNSGIPGNVSTLAVGLMNILINGLTSQLVDRLGRRILLIISSAGSTVSLLALATFFQLQDCGYNTDSLFWLPVISVSGYISMFGLGLGPLPWIIMSEVFPSNLKALCTTISTSTCLSLGFVITFCYPIMINILGMAGIFYFFAICTAASIIFAICLVPETKGRTLDDIQIRLGKY